MNGWAWSHLRHGTGQITGCILKRPCGACSLSSAQQLGFSLKEITELLALRATPETPCADIRMHALAKIDTIEAKIRALHAMKRALTQLVAECPGQEVVTDCPILASLATEGNL